MLKDFAQCLGIKPKLLTIWSFALLVICLSVLCLARHHLSLFHILTRFRVCFFFFLTQLFEAKTSLSDFSNSFLDCVPWDWASPFWPPAPSIPFPRWFISDTTASQNSPLTILVLSRHDHCIWLKCPVNWNLLSLYWTNSG